MPDPFRPNSVNGSRVITLAAFPDGTEFPIDVPPWGLIEVLQISEPIDIPEYGSGVQVVFVYETEARIEQHEAIVPFDWFLSQLPMRTLVTIPDSLIDIDSTVPLMENPLPPTETGEECQELSP
jgi:hypothetical protein